MQEPGGSGDIMWAKVIEELKGRPRRRENSGDWWMVHDAKVMNAGPFAVDWK